MSTPSGFDNPFLIDRRAALAAVAAGSAALALGGNAPAPAVEPAIGLGRDQPFDIGWRFLRGDGTGLEAAGLDDTAWQGVNLPHDWSIADLPAGSGAGQVGPFLPQAEAGGATGFTVGGEGWYRKHFRLAPLPTDARVELVVDGAYFACTAWLNGRLLGDVVNGYIPFAFDLTPHLARSGPNVLALWVRNLGLNSRWYSGSGLYRGARIEITAGPARIERWGVHARTRRIDANHAEIAVTTAIAGAVSGLGLRTRLRDAQGRIVAEATSEAIGEVHHVLRVTDARLWSPANPSLYRLESELVTHDITLDRVEQPFGIRIVTIDATRGLAINGTPLQLRGGCIHHDNGLLGACAESDADERRIRLLKARGFNAIRSSHNPASNSLRAACDRLGMLLIEEAFDAWAEPKNPDDFAVHFAARWQEVIRAMVLPARNSPSVIMWSIGNEICGRNSAEGMAWSWQLANEVHRLDPSRPVTAALNGVLGAPVIASADSAPPGRGGKIDSASAVFIDVPGYNYRLEEIEPEHPLHPERAIYASETFPKDMFRYAALAERAPWFLGEFVWTAMDYLGEAGIGKVERVARGQLPSLAAGWPWAVSGCGDLDLTGQQKAASLARDVAWGISPIEVVVQRPVPPGQVEAVAPWGWPDELASWSWPGAEGIPLSVRVFARADAVDLRLNGKVVARKLVPAGEYGVTFELPFAPGRLSAHGWRGGVEIASRVLETAGSAAALQLVPEPVPAGARPSLRFVAVQVVDSRGRVLSDAEVPLSLAISGPVELAGFGSGNPYASGSFQQRSTRSYRGRAMAILRHTGSRGTIRVAMNSAGLAPAEISLPRA